LEQPHAAIVPLVAALAYIHQKFLVLTSAFQCDLQQHHTQIYACVHYMQPWEAAGLEVSIPVRSAATSCNFVCMVSVFMFVYCVQPWEAAALEATT